MVGGGGEPQSGGQQLSSVFPQGGPIALKLSQNIAKSMAYIIDQSCGDFQQGGFLYKLTCGSQWTPEHLWTSDSPHKQASARANPSTLNFGCGILVIS